MKIVILDAYTANPGDLSWGALEALGDLTLYDRTPLDDETEILKRIGDADVVLTNKTPLSGTVIKNAPNLRYIGVLATGYNIVDIAAAKEKGIPVANVPAYSTDSVAQLTIALLLEICHHVGHHSDAVHAGRWENSADFCFWDFPLIELAGKTIGIIGFGSIGQSVARIAKALGMRVVAYSRTEKEAGRALAEYVPLDRLLAESDVISLHCPLSEATQGIINKETIAKMKDGAILLNSSRGPLLVDQDVADALDSGKLAAAAVDVASKEPINGDNPLLKAKNCMMTPHIAWAPKEARTRLLDIASKNLQAFIDGAPQNVVNP